MPAGRQGSEKRFMRESENKTTSLAKDNFHKKGEIFNFYLRTKGGRAEVSGRSMEPILRESWKVEVEPVSASKVRVGDIIVFGQDYLTCHRVMGKAHFLGRTYFIQKGDNSYMGGIVEGRDLIGRVDKIFNQDSEEIDKKKWQNNSIVMGKPAVYIYLLLYLIKKTILGDRKNKFTGVVNRLCWKFFA